MKLAIMQPYLFSYIGYFQLINVVDKFVIYNDVNYITRGWINRNKILLKGKAYLLTLSLSGNSQNKLINEILISNEYKSKNKLIETIKHAYSKAPQYAMVFHLLKDIILNREERLCEFIEYSLIRISDYLDIKTELLFSSGIAKDKALKGQEKILEICKILKATEYINPIGGMEIYSKKRFEKNNIGLYFIKTKNIVYRQFNNDFVPNLSIIDILMFNSKDEVKKLLSAYELI